MKVKTIKLKDSIYFADLFRCDFLDKQKETFDRLLDLSVRVFLFPLIIHNMKYSSVGERLVYVIPNGLKDEFFEAQNTKTKKEGIVNDGN